MILQSDQNDGGQDVENYFKDLYKTAFRGAAYQPEETELDPALHITRHLLSSLKNDLSKLPTNGLTQEKIVAIIDFYFGSLANFLRNKFKSDMIEDRTAMAEIEQERVATLSKRYVIELGGQSQYNDFLQEAENTWDMTKDYEEHVLSSILGNLARLISKQFGNLDPSIKMGIITQYVVMYKRTFGMNKDSALSTNSQEIVNQIQALVIKIL